MDKSPQVVFSNYEEYEVWFNHHVTRAWDRIGFPTHMHRGDIRLPTSSEINKDTILTFIKEEIELELLCTEDIVKPTYEQFFVLALCEKSKIVLTMSLEDDGLWYRIYSHDIEDSNKIAKQIGEYFISEPEISDTKNKFAFWQMSDEGCHAQYSYLECPDLDSLKDNYNADTFTEVNRILNLEEPYKHGKIVLWHGPPGNGKTYLIRAAAKYWIKKFDIVPEVIIDPQQLFTYSRYLTTLLLRRTAKKNQPFRLFIAEDCAQLFSSEGRSQEGFDRLLNIADGLLGQGQKIVFLFTANERIDNIDPAILRPGRCLQNVLIDNWDMSSACKWLKKHDLLKDHEQNVKEKTSLAELYAMLNGVIPAKQHKNDKFGFNS